MGWFQIEIYLSYCVTKSCQSCIDCFYLGYLISTSMIVALFLLFLDEEKKSLRDTVVGSESNLVLLTPLQCFLALGVGRGRRA